MLIGNLYDLEAFKGFCDSASARGFQDSDAGVVLARQLTAVDPKIFEKKYPELTFVNSGIRVDNTGGYASRIQSLRVVDEGRFSINGDKDGNKGKISLRGEDSFLNSKQLDAQSEWTYSEIEEAKLQNINLAGRYLAAHNKIYMREIDEIGLVGHSNTTGLLNGADFTTTNSADVVENLNPKEKYDVIACLITDQHNAVSNTMEYSANRVMMPTRVYNDLNKTILDTAASSDTVMTALRKNFKNVMFMASFRADDAAGGGNLANSRVVAYSNNEQAMLMRIPVPLKIGKITHASSFKYHVESLARVAGLDVLETTAGRYLTGL